MSKVPDDKAETPAVMIEGKVVSLVGNMLMMRSADGQQFYHTIVKDAALTRDGIACVTRDLRVGRRIRVTTKNGNRALVTSVESLEYQLEFQSA